MHFYIKICIIISNNKVADKIYFGQGFAAKVLGGLLGAFAILQGPPILPRSSEHGTANGPHKEVEFHTSKGWMLLNGIGSNINYIGPWEI